jgi:ABC-type Na+ efflux pump permease subunit
MIVLIVTVCVLSVLVVILGFTTLNLLKKNEKQEDIVVGYMQYLDKLSRIIEASDTKLKEVDKRGIFEKDDDVGIIFSSILEVQKILNEFNIKKFE